MYDALCLGKLAKSDYSPPLDKDDFLLFHDLAAYSVAPRTLTGAVVLLLVSHLLTTTAFVHGPTSREGPPPVLPSYQSPQYLASACIGNLPPPPPTYAS